MASISDMTDDARRYYDGGKRAMIGGIPCRVASHHGRTPGVAFIKAAVAGQVAIDGDNRPDECSRFRFTPARGAREEFCKPSSRGNYSYPNTRGLKTWRPAAISLAPYSVLTLTDTSDEEADAKGKWRDNGNPKPLRDWLAKTAGERRAYWAAYDAAQAGRDAPAVYEPFQYAMAA